MIKDLACFFKNYAIYWSLYVLGRKMEKQQGVSKVFTLYKHKAFAIGRSPGWILALSSASETSVHHVCTQSFSIQNNKCSMGKDVSSEISWN